MGMREKPKGVFAAVVGIGALLTWAANTSPKKIVSHISELLGIVDSSPEWLKSPAADIWLHNISAGVAVLAFLCLLYLYWRKEKPVIIQSAGTLPAPTNSTATAKGNNSPALNASQVSGNGNFSQNQTNNYNYTQPSQRSTPSAFVQRLVPTVKPPSLVVQVRTYGEDSEMIAYGNDILQSLTDAGFNALGFGNNAGAEYFRGVRVDYAPNSESAAAANSIASALGANGCVININPNPEAGWDGQIFVRVGVGHM